ncbi:MAG: right-handed parallel beta-helix repeat-containing protein [Euryarchaeota archaeon]|nr:right-handed parallel beta-helix repeat-containing protein [Euryarchaeota archaeon]
MKKILVSVIVIGLALGGSSIIVGATDPYPSIYISSDNDFNAEHGVIDGDGTITNPYIITGDTYYDVTVTGTTKYFKLYNFNLYHKILVDSVSDHTCTIDGINYYNGELMNSWESVIGICDTRYVKILNCSIVNWTNDQTRGSALNLYDNNGDIPPEYVLVKNCTFDAVNNVVCVAVSAHGNERGHIFTECHFSNCHVGIVLSGNENISINNCTFIHHSDEAIAIFDTNNIIIEDCNFSNAVTVEVGADPVLGYNGNLTIRRCNATVIYFLDHFIDGIIENCTFRGTNCGIITQNRRNMTSLIIRNNAFSNNYAGIYFNNGDLSYCFGNVTNLQIYSNYFIRGSYGIVFCSSLIFDNLIYNNYFSDDLEDAYGEYGVGGYVFNQTWNISKTPGTNIIGGPYLGGNYWPDYSGMDTDGDGLGNTNIPHHGLDYLPLTDRINNPPFTPDINGPSSGKPGTIYTYTMITTDPDNDNVYYYVDWGDSTNSGWLGPYISGAQASTTHSWNAQGTYTVKVKAKDVYSAESDWRTLSVTMPLDLQSSRQSNPTPQSQPSIQPSGQQVSQQINQLFQMMIKTTTK